MNPFREYVRYETRRQFFSRGANALGWAALGSLMGNEWLTKPAEAGDVASELDTLTEAGPPA